MTTTQSTTKEEIQKLIASEEANTNVLNTRISDTITMMKNNSQEAQAMIQADTEREKRLQAQLTDLDDQIKELRTQKEHLEWQKDRVKDAQLQNNKQVEKYEYILSSWPDNKWDIKSIHPFSPFEISTYFGLRSELFKNSRLAVVLENVLAIQELINSSEISEMMHNYKLAQIAQMTDRNEWFFIQCNTTDAEITQLKAEIDDKKTENLSYAQHEVLREQIAQLNEMEKSFVADIKIRNKIQDNTLTEKEAKQYKLEYWSNGRIINDIYAKFKEVEQKLISLWAKRYQDYTTVLYEKNDERAFGLLQEYENELYSKLFHKNNVNTHPLALASCFKIIKYLDIWITEFIKRFVDFCNNYKPSDYNMPTCTRCRKVLHLSGDLYWHRTELKINFKSNVHYRSERQYNGPGFTDDVDIYSCSPY